MNFRPGNILVSLTSQTASRTGASLAGIVALLGSLLIFEASVRAVDKIRLAMPADAGHFTVPLAQKRGFLNEEGIEAEIITVSGPVANIALASGEIHWFRLSHACHDSGTIAGPDCRVL